MSGKAAEEPYLRQLGATTVIGRLAPEGQPKPLEKAQWAGAVDSVGGDTLAWLTRTMQPGGVIAAFGNAGGAQLATTVLPFILRGVTLVGIDSVMCPRADRLQAWQRLATDLDLARLGDIGRTVGLAEALPLAQQLLDGQVRGRIVVDVNQ